MILKQFETWLRSSQTKFWNKSLSDSSVKQYLNAIRWINKFIDDQKISNKKLEEMTLSELEMYKDIILDNEKFKNIDKKSHRVNSSALKRYVSFIVEKKRYSFETLDSDLKEVDKEIGLTETERLELKKARIGQGKYRDGLIELFKNRCFVTGINLNEVWVASHIKPWRSCNGNERTDKNNGLLLSATIDRLFDTGLITFMENGEIVLSTFISNEQAKLLGLENHKKYNIIFNDKQKEYLKYHNSKIFVDSIFSN